MPLGPVISTHACDRRLLWPWQEGQHLRAAEFPNLKSTLEGWQMARLKLAAVWPQGQVGWGQSRLWECSKLGKGFNAGLFSWSPRNPFLSLLLHLGPSLKGHRVTWASWLEDSTGASLGHSHCLPQPRNSRRLLGSCRPVLVFGDKPWAGKEVKEVPRAGRL